MIVFIDVHKDRTSCGLRWGIEPICDQLPIAPATYYTARNRAPSARQVRDVGLRPEILRVYEQNLCAYGADKVWDQMNKDGITVARCTVERLMRDMGLQGCRRGRISIRTTPVMTHWSGLATWSSDSSQRRPRTGYGLQI